MHTTDPANQNALEVRRFTRQEAPNDFALALQLRIDVFVGEQNSPLDEEPDDYDDEAMHWLLLKAGAPIATGRMLSYQEGCQMRPVAKIGRIAVRRDYRGQRLGERIMQEILAYLQTTDYDQSILDAQTYALCFYEKLGFIAEGEEFDEVGILHRRMRLILR